MLVIALTNPSTSGSVTGPLGSSWQNLITFSPNFPIRSSSSLLTKNFKVAGLSKKTPLALSRCCAAIKKTLTLRPSSSSRLGTPFSLNIFSQ